MRWATRLRSRMPGARSSHGRSVLVYSPANLSAIDGSSVWTQTTALALASAPDLHVSILLSHDVTNERLIKPLRTNPNIEIIDPFGRKLKNPAPSLTPDRAAQTVSEIVTSQHVDAVILRGVAVAERFAQEDDLQGKLWPYLTDIPQIASQVDDAWKARIAAIMEASPILLCQTEELRSFLEETFESVVGKTRLFPPILPEGIEPHTLGPPTVSDLRLCYAGKFASHWNTLEMCALPAKLAAEGVHATLTMVGDKINKDPHRPEFVTEMRRALETSEGVIWVGGVSRAESLGYMAQAHVGLSWRAQALDDSLELSTKLLEYCASGTPPLLNRTKMHERIFDAAYPLFVDSETDVAEFLTHLTHNPSTYLQALDAISEAGDDYAMSRAGERLVSMFNAIL